MPDVQGGAGNLGVAAWILTKVMASSTAVVSLLFFLDSGITPEARLAMRLFPCLRYFCCSGCSVVDLMTIYHAPS